VALALKAQTEYDKFRPLQDAAFESDFDKEVKKITPKKKRNDE
jgi:hypothetical protein